MAPEAKEQTPASERKRSKTQLVRKGDFVLLIDQRWFPCGDVNMELDPERSAIAVVLEDKHYSANQNGLETKDFKHFNVRQYWKDASRPQRCYTHSGIRRLIHDFNERMKPDPGMSPAQQKAIWDGVKQFEKLYNGDIPEDQD